MKRSTSLPARIAAGTGAALIAGTAWAHTGHGATDGWLAGALHPLTGVDHLLVALSVGVLAALFARGGSGRPVGAFVGAIALGLAAGLAGTALPAGTETLIALSVVSAGLLVVWQPGSLRRVLWILVCAFGALHGLVHGAEAPAGGSGLLYAAGILSATGLLSGGGAGVARRLATSRAGSLLLRGGGAATAVAGAVFLVVG